MERYCDFYGAAGGVFTVAKPRVSLIAGKAFFDGPITGVDSTLRDSQVEAIDIKGKMAAGWTKLEGSVETLGEEVSSGTLTKGALYKVVEEGLPLVFPLDRSKQRLFLKGEASKYITFGLGSDFFPLPELTIVLSFKTTKGGGLLSLTCGLTAEILSNGSLSMELYNPVTEENTVLPPLSGLPLLNGEKHTFILSISSSGSVALLFDGTFVGAMSVPWDGTIADPTEPCCLGYSLNSATGNVFEGEILFFSLSNAETKQEEIMPLFGDFVAEQGDFSGALPSGWSGIWGDPVGSGVSVGGEDGWLRTYASGNHPHGVTYQKAFVRGYKTRFSFKYVLPTSNTNVNGLYFKYDNSTTAIAPEKILPPTDTPKTVTVDADVFGAWRLHFLTLKDGANSFLGAGSSADDVLYIKDFSVTFLHEEFAYRNIWGTTPTIVDSNTRNGSFKDWDGALPDGWTKGSLLTINKITDDSYGDSPNVVELVASGGHSSEDNHLSLANVFEIGKCYKITIVAKRTSESGSLVIGNGLTPIPNYISWSDSYQAFTLVFFAGSISPLDHSLTLSGAAAGQVFRIASIEIQRLGIVAGFSPKGFRKNKIVNAAGGIDALLPNGGVDAFVEEYFTSNGTESCDPNNKAKQVLTPSSKGMTIVSKKEGSIESWFSIEEGFDANNISVLNLGSELIQHLGRGSRRLR